MKIFTLALLVLIIPVAIQSQAGKTSKRAEDELRALEEHRRLAIRNGDEKTLREIYADDFSAITGSGAVINREQLLVVFRRNDRSVEFTTDEISIRVFGSTAIFVGRLTGRTTSGEIVSSSRFSHLFVKRRGKWQCVAGQSTPLPRPA